MTHKECIYCSEVLVYPSPKGYADAMAIVARKKVGICLSCCSVWEPLPEELRSKVYE